MLDVCLLGCGGMLPLPSRFLSSLLLRLNGRMLLVDCGEGTQITMRELGWGFVNLDFILTTHFHADHVAGLPGLLLSLSNYGRTQEVTLVGPVGLGQVVNSLKVIAPELGFSLKFIELSTEDKYAAEIMLGEFRVSALPLSHSLPCLGYSISIPRKGKFDPRKAIALNIPIEYWKILQEGKSFLCYKPEMVLGPPRKGLKVSYITDTLPIDTIPDFVFGSDLFICEGMYGDEEYKEKGETNFHMTFADAAKLAVAAEVEQLWLTHFSPALTAPENYLERTKEIFDNTVVGHDRMTKTLKFVD